jgi:hypothetical protein
MLPNELYVCLGGTPHESHGQATLPHSLLVPSGSLVPGGVTVHRQCGWPHALRRLNNLQLEGWPFAKEALGAAQAVQVPQDRRVVEPPSQP